MPNPASLGAGSHLLGGLGASRASSFQANPKYVLSTAPPKMKQHRLSQRGIWGLCGVPAPESGSQGLQQVGSHQPGGHEHPLPCLRAQLSPTPQTSQVPSKGHLRLRFGARTYPGEAHCHSQGAPGTVLPSGLPQGSMSHPPCSQCLLPTRCVPPTVPPAICCPRARGCWAGPRGARGHLCPGATSHPGGLPHEELRDCPHCLDQRHRLPLPTDPVCHNPQALGRLHPGG